MASLLIKAWMRGVRFGFRLLYNELAFTYDTVSWVVSFGTWRCWGRAGLPYLSAKPGDRILEIAHGTGNIHLDLCDAGYQVIGVDLSAAMGRITRWKFAKRGEVPRLVRAKAQLLPFPPATFDGAISTFPAEFIVAPETLREVHRILRPGGHFVIVPNAVLTSKDPGARGLELLYRITGQRETSGAHHNKPALDLAQYFGEHGFSVDVRQIACPRSMVTVIIAVKLEG